MKPKTTGFYLLFAAAAVLAVVLLIGSTTPQGETPDPVARGQYLVTFGGCSDCHTPLKMTDGRPVPDLDRYLSGHPEGTRLPAPELKPGPWSAATAGMTAWAGPWGISYAANLTPDKNTGIGIWTEDMFIEAMRTGRHMGYGRPILPPMPWQDIASLNDEDLKAVFAYLRSIRPLTNNVPLPVGPNGETDNFE